MRIRSSNPMFKYATYDNVSQETATYTGVVTKSAFILAIVALTALYTGSIFPSIITSMPTLLGILIGAPIIAIISVIIVHKNPALGALFSFLYAVCEGLFLGVISTIYALQFGGDIILSALTVTFGVVFAMLFLYRSGIIRVGPFFRRLMTSMLFGLIFSSLFLFIIVMISGGFTGVTFGLYTGIVVISVIIATFYLLIDFDNITQLVESGASKEYEWSLSLGLAVTIVWLYIEILRLLAILASRD